MGKVGFVFFALVFIIVTITFFFAVFVSDAGAENYQFQVASVEPYIKDNERAILIEVSSDACPMGERALMLVVSPSMYMDEAPISKHCNNAADTYTQEQIEWLANISLMYLEHGTKPLGEFVTNMDTYEYFEWLSSAEADAIEPEFAGPWYVNRVVPNPEDREIQIWFGYADTCPDGTGYFSIKLDGHPHVGDFEDASTYCTGNGTGKLFEDEAGYLIDKTIAFLEEGHELPDTLRMTGIDRYEYYRQVVNAERAIMKDIGESPVSLFCLFISVIAR